MIKTEVQTQHLCVAKIDARRQSAAERSARRESVVRLHLERVPVMRIVSLTGLSWGAVNAVINKYNAGGLPALEPQPRGRKVGDGRALTSAQELSLRIWIRQRPPHFYGLGDAAWSLETVSKLIEMKFDITLTRRGVGGYLARWGIILDNPNHRPELRCTAAVRKWWIANSDLLRASAKDVRAEIFWLNRPIKLDSASWHLLKTIDCKPQKSRTLHFLSAVSDKGTLHWILFKGKLTSEIQYRFVAALLADSRPKVFAIRSRPPMYQTAGFLSLIGDLKENVNIFPPLGIPLGTSAT